MRNRVNKKYDYDDSDVTEERIKEIATALLWILGFGIALFCEPIATALGF